MSDAENLTEVQAGPSLDLADQEAGKEFVKSVKRGFSLEERLKRRGLRKVRITLYTDEALGAEHAKAVGELAETEAKLKAHEEVSERIEQMKEIGGLPPLDMIAGHEGLLSESEMKIKTEVAEILRKKVDALVERLTASALVFHLQAVPPIIQKDCRRKAKQTIGITEKNVPEDRMDEFISSYNAHLLSVLTQSIDDNETGETNSGGDGAPALSYEDAVALADYLPAGQYLRLSQAVAEIQFRDAISRDIEGQEDFS